MRSFRIPTLVLGLQLGLLTSSAQQPTQSPPTPPPQQPVTSTAAAVPTATEQIRSTVGFLVVAYRNGLAQGGVVGTCFFVVVPDARLGADQGFVYLVTNRHVAQPGIDLGPPYQVQALFLRMNLATPEHGIQSVAEQIPLAGQIHWYFPSDDAVDLAILPVAPDLKRYAYRSIPLSMIAGSDLLKADQVGVGDPVIFARFFSSFSGQTRMEPIVRQGVIAMLPEEKLDTTLHKKGHLFLADLHAFHGNSGSPVFVNLGGFRRGGIYLGERYILVGVISGYYPESAGFSVPAATVLTGEVRDNSGIATIVPAEELTKLLNSHEAQADRDNFVAMQTKKP
jgi:hypothetical protein